MSLKSTVGIARPASPSLRATIPEGIVAFLDLKEGDRLDWKMEIIKGERVVVVRKIAQKGKE
jgi:bifunctional DNA-binding transcriptional regulator/antitoxin component of YhaV-PrlF toxin-antitoxin module